MSQTLSYSPSQRLTALAAGIICHGAFIIAVGTMVCSLFLGMRIGIGPFRGWSSVLANSFLLAVFPISHSWLLSPRGRRFMAALVPLHIGSKISTTTFATLASLQLFTIFLLWSPSGIIWWQADGAERMGIGIAAGCAWLLLGKSMADAQLGMQTGFTGWSSIFLNRKAISKPFATRGLYRYVRHPIYISFALSLWLTSVWTPDQLALALAWTSYCIIGSSLKEKRFIRYFGEAFLRYREQVPFWIPKRPARPPTPFDVAPPNYDVIIIGAGPVGLLLANLLGKAGHRVLIAERHTRPPRGSMAIGITPPSLRILRELDLDRACVDQGVSIGAAHVYENRRAVGQVDFTKIPADHRYILSLPQTKTIELLRNNLKKHPSVQRLEGVEFSEFKEEGGGVRAMFKGVDSGAQFSYSAAYLIGCDGHRSTVRAHTHIRFPGHNYTVQFHMADFADHTDLGSSAHLYFGPNGAVESFPISGNRRRWIIQIPRHTELDRTAFTRQVEQRTGFDLSHSMMDFDSSFQPNRHLATTYRRGRVLLCGDAAHVMSPIGGQGMNTGFADAIHLAQTLETVFQSPATANRCFAEYTRARRHAFNVAARRAARGMWLGTRTGHLSSALRRGLIQRVLLSPLLRKRIASYFAMLTLPGNLRHEEFTP